MDSDCWDQVNAQPWTTPPRMTDTEARQLVARIIARRDANAANRTRNRAQTATGTTKPHLADVFGPVDWQSGLSDVQTTQKEG